MKKILVPVDFSEHTDTVCRFAIEIAKKSGGEVRLFHAYFDYVIVSNSSFPYSVDTNEMFNQEMMINIRNEAKVEMQKLEVKLIDGLKKEKVHNVKVVFTLTGGMPEDEILNTAETYDPDLIVMGTRGKGEKDILTGKISSKVVKNAKCRILTVPRNATYHGFEHLMYASNFNDEDVEDMEKLFDFIQAYNPIVHCVHINIDKDRLTDESRMAALTNHFREKISDGKLKFEIIDNDDFLEGVNEYVKKNKIDITALVHHRKGFLKSLFTKDHARELLFHSDVPLYIFQGKN
nr:universal stress protein [Bacteroidota bacterium]